MLPYFTQYVALGDSMSIDLYPALDAGATDVAVALERHPGAGVIAALGAASLFHANDDARWPEDEGDDLVHRYPGIELLNVATDGATIGDVFGEQLAQVGESEAATLVTLTVGGNDLLSAFANRPRASLLDAIARDVMDAYELLLDAVRRARPASLVILTTIYDPSDGTAHIPGAFEDAGPLPLHVLDGLNAGIRTLGAGTPGVTTADVHAHFLGHGVATPEPAERWYWRRSLVEPGARGAHKIRRAWRQALDDADARA